jgi:hypothetical protein
MTTPAVVVDSFPDAESAVLYVLGQCFGNFRFVTSVPAGDLAQITARIRRISGASRDIYLDRPIIDIDVFGPASQHAATSQAARDIEAVMISLASQKVLKGVIQHASVISGARQLPEANVDVVRYSATYEVLIHA